MSEIEKEEIRKAANSMIEVISGVLIGVETVAIIQLVGLEYLDGPLTDALYCFATSMPQTVARKFKMYRYQIPAVSWPEAW